MHLFQVLSELLFVLTGYRIRPLYVSTCNLQFIPLPGDHRNANHLSSREDITLNCCTPHFPPSLLNRPNYRDFNGTFSDTASLTDNRA